MKKIFRNIFFIIVAAVVLGTAIIGISLEKQFSVENFVVDAVVQKDGSMQIEEERTLKFKNGPFTRAYIDIPLKGCKGIENVEVIENGLPYKFTKDGSSRPQGHFTAYTEGQNYHIEWYFNEKEGTRTFQVNYRVVDCVTLLKDTAQLYWKFIGSNNTTDTKHAKVTVHIPEGAKKDTLKVWGHGPLSGKVSIIDSSTAAWEVKNLPKDRYLEARFLFPKSLISDGKVKNEGIDSNYVLNQEMEWAKKADEERRKIRLSYILGFGFMALVFLVNFLIYLKKGKKFRPPVKLDYYRELPGSYSPAEMVYLFNFRKLKSSAFSSTIMDLARRGYLTIELIGSGRKKEVILHKIKACDGNLAVHEAELMNFIFNGMGSGSRTSVSDIKRIYKAHPGMARTFWKRWKSQINSLSDKNNFFDNSSIKHHRWGFLLVFIFIIGGSFLSANSDMKLLLFFTVLFSCIITLIFTLIMPRRTAYGEEQFMLWKAFKKFLSNFSNLQQAEVPQLILWEHYLVFAAALGVAKKVLKQLPTVYPELRDPSYASAMNWCGMYRLYDNNMYHQGDPFESIDSISDIVSSIESEWNNVVSSFSSGSSSSSGGDGGGGGFSSGGGDGGGGGSFGAD